MVESNLAEVAHASLTACGEKNLSLVDTAIADITDSVRLQAKWENRMSGEKATGRGPSGLDLIDRNEKRQMNRANTFITEQAKLSSIIEPEEPCKLEQILDSRRTHRRDKVTRISNKEVQQESMEYSAIGDNTDSPDHNEEAYIHKKQLPKDKEITTSVNQKYHFQKNFKAKNLCVVTRQICI